MASRPFSLKDRGLFQHQVQAVRDLIDHDGVFSLLWEVGAGKGLALDTPIPTPSGWTTMGELQTGDEVIAVDGTPTKIIAHEPYEAECVDLTFSNDEVVRCDLDHLWLTEDNYERNLHWKRNSYARSVGRLAAPMDDYSEVRETRDIVDTLTYRNGARHRIRLGERWETPSAIDLPLDPYLLGVWLGDGSSRRGAVFLNTVDSDEILNEIRSRGEKVLSRRLDNDRDTCEKVVIEDLTRRLRLEGLLQNKHVPEVYLRASFEQRLDLLRGLMDTDGSKNEGGMSAAFTSTNENLAATVHELVLSLGDQPTTTEGRAILNGKDCGPKWTVVWTVRKHWPLTLSRAPKPLEPPRQGDRLDHIYIHKADKVGVQTVRCLTVEHPSSLFLCSRSAIPTHNTLPTLTYLELLARARGHVAVLVVAPLSALDVWPDEADKWIPDDVTVRTTVINHRPGHRKVTALRALAATVAAERDLVADTDAGPIIHIATMNYDALAHASATMPGTKTVKVRTKIMEAIRDIGFDVTVCDEVHRIRGRSSKTSRALQALSEASPRRIGLTGTIAPHGVTDYFGVWRWLNPERFGTNWYDFRDAYCTMGGYMGKQIVGARNLDDLASKIALDASVIRKRDVMDLPPVTEQIIHVPLDGKERKAYLDMEDELVLALPTDLDDDDEWMLADNRLVQWMRLRQLTSGHVTDGPETHLFGDHKIRTAVDLASSVVEAGDKIVVFAHFSADVERFADAAEGRWPKIPVGKITGATPQDERRRLRKEFQAHDGAAIMVAQQRTVSLAINEFVVASHAIFISLSERQEDLIQAIGRLDRKGQTSPVTIWHLHATIDGDSTIDEVVLDAHRNREALERAVTRFAARRLKERA